MKVFFVAQYLYLHITPFSRIIKHLINSEVEAYFVNLLNINFVKKYDESKYNAQLFDSLGIPLKELELLTNDFKQNSFLKIITYPFRKKSMISRRFFQIYFSKLILKRFLFREKPDMVVIGSDLGGVYIRILQDLCEQFGIKVLVIVTHPNLPGSKPIDYNISAKRKTLLKKLQLEKAMYFPHRTMGSYMQTSYIAVSGEAVKRNLINEHIEPHRIFVTGNPVHDELYELITLKENDLKKTRQKLGISNHHKVLVYFTSLSHVKYSEAYLNHINTTINEEFQQVENVTLIIKYHPREDKTSRLLYKNIFGTDRVLYLTDEIDTTLLILLSDMLITDTGSSLVPQAILAKKNSIVLNFYQERSPYQLGIDLLTTNEEDLRNRLKFIHNDGHNPLFDNVIKDNFYRFDGNSSRRCSDLIIKLLNHG